MHQISTPLLPSPTLQETPEDVTVLRITPAELGGAACHPDHDNSHIFQMGNGLRGAAVSLQLLLPLAYWVWPALALRLNNILLAFFNGQLTTAHSQAARAGLQVARRVDGSIARLQGGGQGGVQAPH